MVTSNYIFIHKKFAFTLAEVLITLAIIGVVAAITIPILMNNISDKQYKTAYKKAFSIASQAWAQAVNDNNIVSRPSWIDGASKAANFNAFKSYFKVMVDCNSNNNSLCWSTSGEKYWVNYPTASAFAFIDNSGFAWSLPDNGNGSGASILVDINGFTGPNKFGQDRFTLLPMPGSVDLSDVNTYAGLPTKIIPMPDFPSKDNNECLSGNIHPCYFTTWLMGN